MNTRNNTTRTTIGNQVTNTCCQRPFSFSLTTS